MARGVDTRLTGYQLPAGSYAKLLRSQCDQQCAPDPRLLDEPDFAELNVAGAARAAEMVNELLAAGEPITVPTGHTGGYRLHDAPEWLSTPAIYGGAVQVWIYPDDVCTPASFYGDTRGQVWKTVAVPPNHQR